MIIECLGGERIRRGVRAGRTENIPGGANRYLELEVNPGRYAAYSGGVKAKAVLIESQACMRCHQSLSFGLLFQSVRPGILLASNRSRNGATLTARHLHFEKEVEAILGLPDGMHSYAIIPIGYPMGRLGPTRCAPLSEVVYSTAEANPGQERDRPAPRG